MKKASKWVVTHEPLIFAGLFFGVAIFLAVRYGTHASTVVQAQSGGVVALAFGFLRNFVTSPASRAALDAGQANLPAIASDVAALKDALGTVISHPGGIVAFVEGHIGSLQKEIADLFFREKSIARPITIGSPSPNQPQAGQDGTLKPVLEPVPVDVPANVPTDVPVDVQPTVTAETTTPAAADPLTQLADLVK